MMKAIGKFFLVLGMMVLITWIFSLPVQWLWNGCLVPAVSGVREITWNQAWGILVLCHFLVKSSTSSKGD